MEEEIIKILEGLIVLGKIAIFLFFVWLAIQIMNQGGCQYCI